MYYDEVPKIFLYKKVVITYYPFQYLIRTISIENRLRECISMKQAAETTKQTKVKKILKMYISNHI